MNLTFAVRAAKFTRVLYRAGYVRPSTATKIATYAFRVWQKLRKPSRKINTMSSERAYMWATIAAGFAARSQGLPVAVIATQTDQLVEHFEKRETAREYKEQEERKARS